MPSIIMYLSDNDYEDVRKLAKREGITVGKMIQYIVKSYLYIQRDKGEL